jgi:hypothetical protein
LLAAALCDFFVTPRGFVVEQPLETASPDRRDP